MALDSDAVSLDSIDESIDTLELEYQLGNLPETQYREQLQSYRLQSAAAIKRLIEAGNAGPELELEQEVLAARALLENDETGEAGATIACAECGGQAPVEAGLCPECGTEMTATGQTAGAR